MGGGVSNPSADTVVVRPSSPERPREGTLILSGTVGRVGGSDSAYSFSDIRDFAVDARGRTYVVDNQRQAGGLTVRRFDAAGRFEIAIGRPGQGPGEFWNPSSIWAMPDGAIVLYSAQRLNRYDPSGRPVSQVPFTIGSSISAPHTLTVDTSGVAWILFTLTRSSGPGPAASRQAYLRMRANGSILDTVPVPVLEHPPQLPPASRPMYTPSFVQALSPDGYFVTGYSGGYAIDVRRPRVAGRPWLPEDGITSIRLPYQPVALQPGERAEWQRAMRSRNGRGDEAGTALDADVPRVKPAFYNIVMGLDGRIWVSLPAAARHDSRADVTDLSPAEAARRRWPELRRYDILTPAGGYVGRVRLPDIRIVGNPVMRGDTLWAIVADDNDEQVIRKYRISW